MADNVLMRFIKENPYRGFHAKPYYSRLGDFVTLFFQECDHYADRVDDFLTVYRDMETNEMVGLKLKGITRLASVIGNFGVDVWDDEGEAKLSLFTMAAAAATPNKEAYPQYEEMGRRTGSLKVSNRQLEFMH